MNTGNKPRYYTIKEVADLTGVKQSILRFWEGEFNALSPIKNKFGHRVYTEEDRETICRIKDLLYGNSKTIKEAKKIIDADIFENVEIAVKREMAPSKPLKLVYKTKQVDNKDKIADIKKELSEILDLIKSMKQDGE